LDRKGEKRIERFGKEKNKEERRGMEEKGVNETLEQ
jgi:hypothetical protein